VRRSVIEGWANDEDGEDIANYEDKDEKGCGDDDDEVSEEDDEKDDEEDVETKRNETLSLSI